MSTVAEIENAVRKLPMADAWTVWHRIGDYLERLEAIEGIQRGLDSAKRGEGEPAEQAFARLRKKHGIPVAEIEDAMRKLPIADARAVVNRLADSLDEAWDGQIDRDIKAGKLDHLAARALEHYVAGRTRPLDEVVDNS